MRRAIELSRLGFPAPNPRVGCVIVQEGKTVGEGHHDHAGGPHAEAVALAQAGEAANGADVFCTLEPCNHQGRTPPCSRALISAGVRSVTFAVHDPDPVADGGVEALKAAGVTCAAGLLEDEARAVNRVFLTAVERGRPYVTVKSATTSDGFIARSDGTSKWITGEGARAVGHRLRAEMGCVLVGRVTVERDDPLLTARVDGVVNQPLRVVLDPKAKLDGRYKVFSDGGPTVRFVKEGLGSQPYDVEVRAGDKGFDLAHVLEHLYERGVRGVLVEGGGETSAAFFRSGLVDRLERFTSPKNFGEGKPWLGQHAPDVRLTKVTESKIGEDLHEVFHVEHGT